MPVPPRQMVPSLLQVDAILVRLSGAAALEEVGRFLGAELPQFAGLAVYAVDGTALRRLTNAEALPDETAPPTADRGAVGAALSTRATRITRASSDAPGASLAEIAVPLPRGEAPTAVLYAATRLSAGFDASDGRFLEQVGPKLLAPIAAPRAARPAGA